MGDIGTELAIAIIRVAVGLVLAGHGAQKLFGAFDGPSLERWHGAVASMGFAQPRVFATLAAFAEFFGGLMLAIGFLVPLACAALAVDMAVAIIKVHRPKGMWVTKGGYEYALLLFIVLCVLGLAGTTLYSIDAVLGFGDGAALFLALLALGAVVTAGAALVEQRAGRTA